MEGRYGLRGRHVREHCPVQVPLPFSVADVDHVEDRLVLQALRGHAGIDLDAAQVGVVAGLPPSLTGPALERLVGAGLVGGPVVAGRQRFGLS